MILWNTSIKSGHKNSSIISKMEKGSKILMYSDKKDNFRIGKLTVCRKTERRTPYRLRTENHLIDTYLTTTFLIQKENGKIVSRNLCDIRDTFLFAIYDEKNKKVVFEKYVSLLQDPALMRHYMLEFKNDEYPYYVANKFILKNNN